MTTSIFHVCGLSLIYVDITYTGIDCFFCVCDGEKPMFYSETVGLLFTYVICWELRDFSLGCVWYLFGNCVELSWWRLGSGLAVDFAVCLICW